MREETRWEAKVRASPGHSQWYIDRFAAMRAEGADLDGEARTVDAMLPRGARVLDAGCGPGRVGGALAARGHRVLGVDVDPALIAAARADHPGSDWRVGDLAELDLADDAGAPLRFDLAVCAGNVLLFIAPASGARVLGRIREHLAEDGRLVVGFGLDRGYAPGEFAADAAAAGLVVDARFSTWELRPFTPGSDFLVAFLSPAP
ncbi:class I SAM-dependent methyltransferase [Zafaria sp. Z1313]|uniref:class I SAM-dependent methyltransferase n=1 Tax=unclassified Zafaria TaxID=2828765 RepID=UPI002E77D0DF|nr:class I SAM-dependent methyltransferase [Zafaria sp. J156]MEE1621374.1 class I SAM-dependent methyltransferase [Zafaria sp. J156]